MKIKAYAIIPRIEKPHATTSLPHFFSNSSADGEILAPDPADVDDGDFACVCFAINFRVGGYGLAAGEVDGLGLILGFWGWGHLFFFFFFLFEGLGLGVFVFARGV